MLVRKWHKCNLRHLRKTPKTRHIFIKFAFKSYRSIAYNKYSFLLTVATKRCMHTPTISKTAINNANNLSYDVTLRSTLDINAIHFIGTPTSIKTHNKGLVSLLQYACYQLVQHLPTSRQLSKTVNLHRHLKQNAANSETLMAVLLQAGVFWDTMLLVRQFKTFQIIVVPPKRQKLLP
jgi:hypothetical protein